MTRAFGKKIGRRVMTTPNDSDREDVDFFNVFDGTKGRSPGIYLDMQERIEAEKSRAILEEREADLSDLGRLPAATSTPFVPKERQVDNSTYSNPSIRFTGEKDVDPVVTLSVDTGTSASDIDLSYAAQVARERQSQEDALASESTTTEPTATEPTTDPTPTEPAAEPVADEPAADEPVYTDEPTDETTTY